MSSWCCGWSGCPDAGREQDAANPAVALAHHYRTRHQHQATPVAGYTPAAAWNAIDAPAIRSGKRRSNPQDFATAREVVDQQRSST